VMGCLIDSWSKPTRVQLMGVHNKTIGVRVQLFLIENQGARLLDLMLSKQLKNKWDQMKLIFNLYLRIKESDPKY